MFRVAVGENTQETLTSHRQCGEASRRGKSLTKRPKRLAEQCEAPFTSFAETTLGYRSACAAFAACPACEACVRVLRVARVRRVSACADVCVRVSACARGGGGGVDRSPQFFACFELQHGLETFC